MCHLVGKFLIFSLNSNFIISHAIESRVYAEDPMRNFLPSIGPLNSYTEPPKLDRNGNVIRIDTGVFEGGVISMYYDPMIAKLCSRGNDRYVPFLSP